MDLRPGYSRRPGGSLTTAALDPVSTYIGLVEDAWLWKQAPGVVMVTLPGRKPQPLR
jgi:hypothetical protein